MFQTSWCTNQSRSPSLPPRLLCLLAPVLRGEAYAVQYISTLSIVRWWWILMDRHCESDLVLSLRIFLYLFFFFVASRRMFYRLIFIRAKLQSLFFYRSLIFFFYFLRRHCLFLRKLRTSRACRIPIQRFTTRKMNYRFCSCVGNS